MPDTNFHSFIHTLPELDRKQDVMMPRLVSARHPANLTEKLVAEWPLQRGRHSGGKPFSRQQTLWSLPSARSNELSMVNNISPKIQQHSSDYFTSLIKHQIQKLAANSIL